MKKSLVLGLMIAILFYGVLDTFGQDGKYDAITDVPGVKVGSVTDEEALTGVTVILTEQGAIAGVDVRGSAPGTKETDLLNPINLVQEVNAVVLAGGSGFGLDSATGVMKYLEERGFGFKTPEATVPIVPAAILYDLSVGNPKVRPTAEMGYQACLNAKSGKVKEGNVGAGTGAVVHGYGGGWMIKGGLGTASIELDDGITVGAIVAVNPFGSVVNEKGEFYYKMQDLDTAYGNKTQLALDCNDENINRDLTLQCTTIGVVATNAKLTKTQMTKIAQMAQDGIAMAIRPAHTMWDGDAIFALSVGSEDRKEADVTTVGAAAANMVAKAIIHAVLNADGIEGVPSYKEKISEEQGNAHVVHEMIIDAHTILIKDQDVTICLDSPKLFDDVLGRPWCCVTNYHKNKQSQ